MLILPEEAKKKQLKQVASVDIVSSRRKQNRPKATMHS